MEGQVALVTGGAMGIGRAYVEALLARRVTVYIADINVKRGEQTVDELKKTFENCDVVFQECDVADEEDLKGVFQLTYERFGRLNLVVNNAGILNESDPDMVIEINMRAVLRGTMMGLKYMSTKEGGQGGVIVNTASETGLFRVPLSPFYSASNHAVLGFTRGIGATSLSDHGVRINCICPSTVQTEMLTSLGPGSIMGDLEQAREDVAHMIPLEPKVVADCLIKVLEDATMTGAAILCCQGHPYTKLKLPESLDHAIKIYV